MKKSGWKTILQVIVSVLTAAITALGTTSCMALKREAILIITKGCPQGHPFLLSLTSSIQCFVLTIGPTRCTTCGFRAGKASGSG